MSSGFRFPKSPRPLGRDVVRVTAAYQIEGAVPPNAGRLMFYVDLVRADGAELDLWEGFTRAGALAAAREWESVGLPIVDETHPVLAGAACPNSPKRDGVSAGPLDVFSDAARS